MIIRIEDFNYPGAGIFANLTERELRNSYEKNGGFFIAESPKVIERALNAGYEPISFLMEEKHISGDAAFLVERCPQIPVYTASPELLQTLTGFKLTRGVFCAFRRKPVSSFTEICRNARRIAVLENIADSTNLGAIFRSAAALGIDAVLLTPECADPLNRRCLRVSMGNVFLVKWARIDGDRPQLTSFAKQNLSRRGTNCKLSDELAATAGDRPQNEKTNSRFWPEEGMKILKQMGFKTLAMALRNNSIDVDSPVLYSEEKLAIMLGTEGEGLLPETISLSDYVAKIPMKEGVDSLNVAAAAAVIFWELRRR